MLLAIMDMKFCVYLFQRTPYFTYLYLRGRIKKSNCDFFYLLNMQSTDMIYNSLSVLKTVSITLIILTICCKVSLMSVFSEEKNSEHVVIYCIDYFISSFVLNSFPPWGSNHMISQMKKVSQRKLINLMFMLLTQRHSPSCFPIKCCEVLVTVTYLILHIQINVLYS